MASWLHLGRRFVGSLVPGGPSGQDDAWARTALLSGEEALWDQMSPSDRRHAAGVARRAADALGRDASRAIVAAALLHDVGKIDTGFGPFRRAGASIVAMVVGQERTRRWRRRDGTRGRVGRYLCHDAIGAEMLAVAGSDELTVGWAREHHLAAEHWSLPPGVGYALKAADDD